MTLTITDVEQRLEIARGIDSELDGEIQGGLSIQRIGHCKIVDDGNDKWMTDHDDFEEAREAIIEMALNGELREQDIDARQPHDNVEWYDVFCGETDAIYSRLGCVGDRDSVIERMKEDGQDEHIESVLEELGLDG